MKGTLTIDRDSVLCVEHTDKGFNVVSEITVVLPEGEGCYDQRISLNHIFPVASDALIFAHKIRAKGVINLQHWKEL